MELLWEPDIAAPQENAWTDARFSTNNTTQVRYEIISLLEYSPKAVWDDSVTTYGQQVPG